VLLLVVGVAIVLLTRQSFSRLEQSTDIGQVALGELVYAENCATCHGAAGVGANPEAPLERDDNGLLSAPPHDATGHTWHHPDWQLIQIIHEGSSYADFQSEMPGFDRTLTDEEIEAALAYIKTLWGDDQREFQATVSAQPTEQVYREPFPE
jgi:mono/diheme cytochrome c family protein